MTEYNPECDFCGNCWEYGHNAEDCDNPTCEGQLKWEAYKAEETERRALDSDYGPQFSIPLLCIALIVIIGLTINYC